MELHTLSNKIILESLNKLNSLDPNLDLVEFLQEVAIPTRNIAIEALIGDYTRFTREERALTEEQEFLNEGVPLGQQTSPNWQNKILDEGACSPFVPEEMRECK